MTEHNQRTGGDACASCNQAVIETGMKYCPNCATPVGTAADAVDPLAPAEAPTGSKSSSSGCLPLLLLVIACFLAWFIWALATDDGSSPGGDGDSRGMAEIVCEKFVKDRLKSPSSAKFSDTQASGGDGSWTVRGAVDAENAFGAKLRSNYVCRIQHVSGSEWTLVSMTGLN